MQRQKIHSQLQNTRNDLVFTIVLLREDQNIFRVAAGTLHRIVKTKEEKKQEITENKNKTKKIIHQQLKQPYLYAHSKSFFFSTKIANDVLKQNSRILGVCYYGVK